MVTYLPYIVSVLCAAISGFTSYVVARKQAKADIEKLVTQHELDIEKERQKFQIEKERMELEHKQEMERLTIQAGGQVGAEIIGATMQAFMSSTAGKEYLEKKIREKTGLD